MKIARLIACLSFIFFCVDLSSQALKSVEITTTEEKGLQIKTFNRFQQPGYDLPFVSIRIDNKLYSSLDARITDDNLTILDNELVLFVSDIIPLASGGFNMKLHIKNVSDDTLNISNIVPFGESQKHVYLTSWDKGDPLSRAFIFRPGFVPVNVTLPDNSWGIGLGIINVDNGSSIVALTKTNRTLSSKTRFSRFSSAIYPDGELICDVWMDSYIGRWQEGLRLIFQQNMLYDIEPDTFDNWMYERKDLEWIKTAFVGHFVSAWHNYFYDYEKKEGMLPIPILLKIHGIYLVETTY